MDQETAIDVLRERYARGGLPLEEFRRLMSALMVTTDPVECQAILDQLPPESERDLALPAERRVYSTQAQVSRRTPAQSRKVHRIAAFFGEVNRSNVLWELGPETHVSATFGEARIDVRMAKLIEGENILRLTALFGEVVVVVPEGLQVFVEGSARFGEVSVPGHSIGGITVSDDFALDGPKNGSYLRIEAIATFGEVKIITA